MKNGLKMISVPLKKCEERLDSAFEQGRIFWKLILKEKKTTKRIEKIAYLSY